MATSGASREKRVGERIRSDVMDLLLRGDLRDPGLEGAIVSAVDVSADLSVAHVWMRLMDGSDDVRRQKRVVRAMGRAGGFIRRELGRTLQMRRVPELRFEWDSGADRAARVEGLLAEIEAERRTAPKREEEG